MEKRNKIRHTHSEKLCKINKLYLTGNLEDVIEFLQGLMKSYSGYHSFTLECLKKDGVESLWLCGSNRVGPNEDRNHE